MTTFRPAPAVQRIAERLIPKYHADLVDVRIEFVFRDKAAKSKGADVWGRARKIGGLNAYLAQDGDPVETAPAVDDFFVIEIAEDIWTILDAKQREALVDHELCHCQLTVDDDGEAKLTMRGHDVEEFGEIVQRYGLWSESVVQFVKQIDQLALNFDGDDT